MLWQSNRIKEDYRTSVIIPSCSGSLPVIVDLIFWMVEGAILPRLPSRSTQHSVTQHSMKTEITWTWCTWLNNYNYVVTVGAIHLTKISGNFGPKLNGSVRSNRKSFEKTGPPFEVVLFSRSDRLEFWLNGSRPVSCKSFNIKLQFITMTMQCNDYYSQSSVISMIW